MPGGRPAPKMSTTRAPPSAQLLPPAACAVRVGRPRPTCTSPTQLLSRFVGNLPAPAGAGEAEDPLSDMLSPKTVIEFKPKGDWPDAWAAAAKPSARAEAV